MLEFCFDYSCPYAYLASTQIRALAEEAGVELVYKPFLLGGVFKSLGAAAPDAKPMPAPRAMLNALDMRRWAEHWQVPLNMPATHPNRTVTALRATLAAGVKPEAVHALYEAYWKHGRNLSDPAVVVDALNGVGLNGSELVERASDPAIKAELRERTDEAIARGVFGAPAMFLDGELYWGQDRLAMLARALGVPEEGALRFGAGDRAARADGQPLEFWYDFSSPFAYLASTQVEALAQRTGARLLWRPFLLGGLFRSIGSPNVPLHSFAEAKQRYFRTDMQRHADAYAVPLCSPTRSASALARGAGRSPAEREGHDGPGTCPPSAGLRWLCCRSWAA